MTTFVFPAPSTDGYTVYTKRDCGDCEKVKAFLKSKAILYTTLECDNFLTADREAFIAGAREAMGASSSTMPVRFPLVFARGAYVGGYLATRKYVEAEDEW